MMNKEQKKDFDKRYFLLDNYVKEILQVMALLYEPENQTDTINVILGCGIRSNPEKALKYNDVKAVLILLYERDFLSKNADGRFCLHLKHQDYIILKYCSDNPAINKYLKSIESKLGYSNGNAGFSFYGNYNAYRKERDFRNSLFLENKQYMSQIRASTTQEEYSRLCARSFVYTFTPQLFDKIPEKDKLQTVLKLLSIRAGNLLPLEDLLSFFKNVGCVSGQMKESYTNLYVLCLMLTGNIVELQKICQQELNLLHSGYYMATIQFMQGNIASAKKLFEKEIDFDMKHYKTKTYCPPLEFGLFYALSVMASGDALNPFFIKFVNLGIKESEYVRTYYAFKAYIAHEKGDCNNVIKFIKKSFSERSNDPIMRKQEYIFVGLILILIDEKYEGLYESQCYLEDLLILGFKNGYNFAAYQAFKLLPKISKTHSPRYLKDQLNVRKNHPEILLMCEKQYVDFSQLMKVEDEWKKALKVLKNISSKKGKAVSSNQDARIIWLFDYYNDDDGICSVIFSPFEQKRQKSGKWSKGRKVALKRIMNNELDSMSALDAKIGRCITEEKSYDSWGYYGSTEFIFDYEKAIPLLAKHSYLFLEKSPSTPIELIEEKLQLVVREDVKGGCTVSFSSPFKRTGVEIVEETPTRYKYKNVTQIHFDIAKTFDKKTSLFIPDCGKSELKSILGGLSSLMPVHSDIAGLGDEKNSDLKKLKGETVPHIHLLPIAEGIRAELFVRPFKNAGPYFKPGHGAAHVLAEVNGKSSEASRNLKKEIANAEDIVSNCPSLGIRGNYNGSFNFETVEECLEFLLELNEVKTKIIIEWPEGGKLRVSQKYDLNDIKFAVRKQSDWFDMSVNLQVDENKVIDMYELLEKAGNSKFVELSNGEFIALTEQLKKKLEELNTFSYRSKDKMKIHPLNLHQIDDLLDDCTSFKPGKLWKDQLRKIEDAEKYSPEIPSTLQADLRPYQEDGFKWLSRLAKWGVGACLADDMGLGKTVQALAAILEHAQNGPTLVVAPSSVCMNWINESAKFAPSLNPLYFGDGKRKDTLKKLKPFDLLVTSYGLLLSEEDILSEMHWSIIVLDEAQFIKNYKAKRTKAAFALNGDHKIITTGTPVENHLSELWTLFSFINPGLLGTQSEFSAKFAIPIEKEGDKKVRTSLKKVIQPFLLRRNKIDVLDELPPKTEINISIEFSDQERAFYEALRRKSVATINDIKEGAKGAVHLQVLAELTKLRQACCNPSLISSDCNIESSKLNMFKNTLNELSENKHKALVFSQFVGHLKILRSFCDDNNISYQYLDGSTPAKERAKRVDAFQAGEGDIFLISLKAGGTGLNLTAANYVIHMDPWWNPAVEDQASDRTHRIGQRRPVTIYRFVAKDTVEEKIIALHKQKRELADSLLDGADVSAKMSLDELMVLLK